MRGLKGRMSTLGHKRPSKSPPRPTNVRYWTKADKGRCGRIVGFVPKADMSCWALTEIGNVAAPLRNVMNSRLLIPTPEEQDKAS